MLHQNQLDLPAKLLQKAVIQNAQYDGNSADIWVNSIILGGNVLMEQGWWSHAIQKYEEVCDMFRRQKHSNKLILAQAKRRVANIYILQGEFTKAQSYLNAAEGIVIEVGDQYELGRVYYELGLLYSITGKLERAKQYVLDQIKIAETLENAELCMRGYAGLGHIYRQTYEWPKARESFTNALLLAEKIHDQRAQGWILLGIGRIEYFEGVRDWIAAKTTEQREQAKRHYQKAYTYFNSAAKILSENKYRYRYELAQLLLGKVILDDIECQFLPPATDKYGIQADNADNLDPLAKARALYNQSLNGFEEMGCKYYTGKVLQYLCELSCKAADFQQGKAKHYLSRADEEIEEYIRRIRTLDDRAELAGYDHKYPQHMARAMVEHAVIAIKQGHLKLAAERFCSAFYYANSFNRYLSREIEDKFDLKLDLVKQAHTLRPDELKFLDVQRSARGATIATHFCVRVADLLQAKKSELPLTSSGERLQCFDMLIQALKQKARDIEMNWWPLSKGITIPK